MNIKSIVIMAFVAFALSLMISPNRDYSGIVGFFIFYSMIMHALLNDVSDRLKEIKLTLNNSDIKKDYQP